MFAKYGINGVWDKDRFNPLYRGVLIVTPKSPTKEAIVSAVSILFIEVF